MTIRPRRPDDLPGCVVALAVVHAVDGYPVRWPADPAAWLSPPGLAEAWVALVAGTVVGHIGRSHPDRGEPTDALARAAGTPTDRLDAVSRLYVVPSARRAGTATALLDAAVSAARRRGNRLVLDVSADGGVAIALYERLGWQRVVSARATWLAADGHPALVHHYLSPGPAPTAV